MRIALSCWLLSACASHAIEFPARPPVVVDHDDRPVSVPCRPDPSPKDPTRVACTPVTYESTPIWSYIDNSLFARISRGLRIATHAESINVNSLDEVPSSSWFADRIGAADRKPTSELATGACRPEDLLPTDAPDGSWVIDHGKDDGTTPGFRITVPGHGKYMLKADEASAPERSSAGSVIGARVYHAAGFNTTCEQIVYLRPEQLRLLPNLVIVGDFGISHPFDRKRLDAILAASPHRGTLVRFQASKWLPGYPIGSFRYEGVRADDPNDVIPHQQRRELRGSRLLAAWLSRWDSKEQNTFDAWIAVDATRPWSSPGFVRHYIIDTSEVLGQRAVAMPEMYTTRLGHSYGLDPRDMFVDFATLGAVSRPWDRARVVPGRERFSFFSATDFDPEGWTPSYPNPAFLQMTERDGAWMARIIARFSPADVRAIVEGAAFSDPDDTTYITEILLERQRKILVRYLSRLSPIADVRVTEDNQICGTDLARARAVFPAARFRYTATEIDRSLPVSVLDDGRVCFTPGPGVARRTFELRNGITEPLEIQTYPSGATTQIAALRRVH